MSEHLPMPRETSAARRVPVTIPPLQARSSAGPIDLEALTTALEAGLLPRRRERGLWRVPSSSLQHDYTVRLWEGQASCTCPARTGCSHIAAARTAAALCGDWL